ncbi:Glyoxylase, beta-lactamase superfamily II [Luteibacter sp. UNCMF331Sha3.1]|uniref:N-acyl homoserine lactonase family protein n=1 Tax=Luteibacter sp. UNCMF331Sha3.1 TaxID=1502760 RepID=UPI0008CAD5C8|nr:N-acyl homoserine lactonase family protein [Luteibacter sp. UNCMF331Sha3.1]SEM57673.1 Glyoxylase, beta-lactamase superfamily II [Luteibacter sp. UNCMF331Sha3.1]
MTPFLKARLSSILAIGVLVLAGASVVRAATPLPDPAKAGFADRLYRLDCGDSLANDESVWTPGKNIGKRVRFSSTCWLIRHGGEWLLWDTGVPESALNDPRGWSTLPKLIVYHLDKSITAQLAAIGLTTGDVAYVAVSHTHGDHIGNVALFPDATVLIQRAEYEWIRSPDGANANVNQLKALARQLMGSPKRLRLLDGDTDVFGDGSVMLVSTPGHTPGSQSLLVHLRKTGFVILSGDVAHSADNLEHDIVPSLNTDKAASVASMDHVKAMIETYRARIFINHDKAQEDALKLLPAFYD